MEVCRLCDSGEKNRIDNEILNGLFSIIPKEEEILGG